MIYIPTWLNNLLLLAAFVAGSLQYWVADPVRRIVNRRFAVLVVCVVLMTLATFFNESGPWVSLAVFAGALLCVTATWRLQRSMPAKPVEH